jgi:hypothetical protein
MENGVSIIAPIYAGILYGRMGYEWRGVLALVHYVVGFMILSKILLREDKDRDKDRDRDRDKEWDRDRDRDREQINGTVEDEALLKESSSEGLRIGRAVRKGEETEPEEENEFESHSDSKGRGQTRRQVEGTSKDKVD